VADLARMATDAELHDADGDDPRVWAPLHAWRALGQLRAETAIEPLLGLLRYIDERQEDWITEELPVVFGLIGPAGIPALEAYAAGPNHGLYARMAAGGGLKEIGQAHPAARDECVAALARLLDAAEHNDEGFNGFLIADLLALRAVEAAPVMEKAFAGGWVDEMIAGDWGDVQIELGLLDESELEDEMERIGNLLGPLPASSPIEPERPVPEHIRAWNEALAARKRAAEEAQAARREKKKRKRGRGKAPKRGG
jgi:hypothetical protein